MDHIDTSVWWLTAFGSAVVVLSFLRSIGRMSFALAAGEVEERRAKEELRKKENAAAEAAGRAAALEPLALNPDGSIEEPILAVAEPQES
jgi:hypothetical protein